MAFELLRTDYVDATFEGLRRYLMSENGDGSVSFHDVTNYTVQEKSFFGAKDANTINTAVNAILAALENGTDLYEVFTQFFELQKALFLEESDAKQGDFADYIAQLIEYMDQKWDELKAEYTGDIQYFKDVQENAFNVWFQMVRDQLTNDVAGHLQTQIGNLDLLDTEDKESLVNAVNELKGADNKQNKQIGNLNDLQTEGKSSLVEAINAMGDRITSAVTTLKDGISKAVKKSGDTMTGTLHSSKKTQTYLAGNKGDAIINSTAPAGEYVMLDKLNSQNGYFTDGVFGTKRELHYTSKATVDAGTNSVEQTLVLMDENGNATFPQEVKARMFIGLLAGSAQRAQADRSGRDIEDEYVRNSDLRSKTRLNVTAYIRYDAGTSMQEEYVPLTTRKDCNSFSLKYYLVIGVGSSSNGTTVGNIDFARADILYEQINADKSYIWKRLQIGASGSTARWNLIINKNEEGLTVRVPKGSWAEVLILEI